MKKKEKKKNIKQQQQFAFISIRFERHAFLSFFKTTPIPLVHLELIFIATIYFSILFSSHLIRRTDYCIFAFCIRIIP